MSRPSSNVNVTALEEQPLAIDDLQLLHHWHNAAKEADFAPFADHEHLDSKAEYNRTMDLAFRHPYLLHLLLALSALHKLHASHGSNAKLYSIATAHNLSAMRLVRPHITRGDPEHRDAVFNYAAFSSLFAMAEPPLRSGDAAISSDPAVCISALLEAFKMGQGVNAVSSSIKEYLESSGSLQGDLWEDNRQEIIPTLKQDYPQLKVLETVVAEHCTEQQRSPCCDAIKELFISFGVLATSSKDHSSLWLIMTWPMHLNSEVHAMFEAKHPVGLVMLAHYAALMNMRSNYWFFSRWPPLLMASVSRLLPSNWQSCLQWPRSMMDESIGP